MDRPVFPYGSGEFLDLHGIGGLDSVQRDGWAANILCAAALRFFNGLTGCFRNCGAEKWTGRFRGTGNRNEQNQKNECGKEPGPRRKGTAVRNSEKKEKGSSEKGTGTEHSGTFEFGK